MESLLPDKPSSYHQLISNSLIIYRLAFAKIAFFAFLLALVVFIPRLISDIIGQDLFFSLPPLSPHRLWLVVVDLAALVFFIAIIWHMHCELRGRHEPLLEDVTTGVRKVISVFVASIIQCAIIFAISVIIYGILYVLYQMQLLFINSLAGIILTACIFFGQLVLLLYVSTLFVFQLPLIAIENKGVFSAIENSILLVYNHWWRVFSVQITPWLVYIFTLAVVKYVLNVQIHLYFTNKSGTALQATMLNIFLFTIFIPWVAALLVSQMKDLELRKKLAPKRNHR